ncbi:MAG: hypothetical protein ACJ8HI_10455, partial [Massilia sp.]
AGRRGCHHRTGQGQGAQGKNYFFHVYPMTVRNVAAAAANGWRQRIGCLVREYVNTCFHETSRMATFIGQIVKVDEIMLSFCINIGVAMRPGLRGVRSWLVLSMAGRQ